MLILRRGRATLAQVRPSMPAATIQVTEVESRAPDTLAFAVTVTDPAGESVHHVTASNHQITRLAGGHPAADLLTAAFRFLLDREPRTSILGRFELSVISRYFPDFERELPQYLSAI